ncbi:Ubiquitin carboxyl-terminal hydrolase family protein [Spironucleus salmonicida]|uniref:Ubiquitin carboxyl-terminal hydrolase n=1 Tax=Spironucleus salmonicida TaxID=348837 RepID=V6LMI8_9EUKA|nr:Ubiquitin carboxyl-terminal hydrolase family protein [Spironucleus salmonicida]|eukprot:EST45912.1 Ubiquitin carboxyl-terminal hydrolase family protein [Spironucleus salmonicida]
MSDINLKVFFKNNPFDITISSDETVETLAVMLSSISELDIEYQILISETSPSPLQLQDTLASYNIQNGSKLILLGNAQSAADPAQKLTANQLENVRRSMYKNRPVGMSNDGNLCYLASAVQVLTAISPLAGGLAEARDSGSTLAAAVCKTIKQLGARETVQQTAPLGDSLRGKHPQFALGKQQDAQEALFLIERELEDDLNLAAKGVGFAAQLSGFLETRKLNELFECQFGEEKETFLRVPVKAMNTVEETISAMLGDKLFGRLPGILQIQLMRFAQSGETLQKITRKIAFAPEMSMQEFCGPDCTVTSFNPAQPLYHLKAVICHKGLSVDGGHYITYAKHGKVWYQFDDAIVQQVDEITVLATAGSAGEGFTAYVLIYCVEELMI